MNADMKKRLVSAEQLQTLLDFMREHPDLAKGLSRGRRGKLMTVKVWNTCAKKLNSMKDGAVKNGKGWSKYWCDWKYRVRRHALELKVARDTNKSPPERITELSPLEENIMSIIGDSSLDEVVVKTDPLVDEDSNDAEEETNVNEANPQYREREARSARRRRPSPAVTNLSRESDGPRDSPPPQRARLGDVDESDFEEDDLHVRTSREFLRLEQKKLECSLKMEESLASLTSAVLRLANTMDTIKDVLLPRLDVRIPPSNG